MPAARLVHPARYALVALLATAACGDQSSPAATPASPSSAPAARGREPDGPALARPASSRLDELAPEVRRAFESQPGFAKLGKPKPGDWLDRHPEPGQSVTQFERAERVVPSAERRTIFILPISVFPAGTSPSLPLLAEYVRRFFGLDARVLPGLTDGGALGARRRVHFGVEQLLTADLLDALRERVPASAYGLVGVTMSDLFPHPRWNYVFGEARFAERVGVYSFARYDPAFHREPRGPSTEHTILERSLKVMTHEIGHMFGIAHCTAHRCLMNGSNSLAETDGSPMHLCPSCLRKLHLAIDFTPESRYRTLEAFYSANGFTREAEWTEDRIRYLHGREQARAEP